MKLRPYQEAAVERVREHARAGVKRILIQSPTGTGKTVMGLEPAMAAIRKGGQVLWLAHRRELISQAADGLVRAGMTDIGVVLSGTSNARVDAPLQVGSIQTLFARGHRPDARVVVWDEAHHATARTYRTVAAAYPDAYHLGLTATPERADRTSLGDVFERMVVAIASADAVAAGYLVPCRVYAPATATDRLSEDPLTAWQRWAAGRQTVVFTSSVGEAETLAARFTAAGHPAAAVSGTTPAAERADTLAAFAARRLRVLTNCQVLTEGWDCPGTEAAILARGCGSAALFLQMVGRVLRPAPGKDYAVLVDLRGVVHVHGMPHDARRFSLSGTSIALEGRLDAIRQCVTCGAVFRAVETVAGKCPVCGEALPVVERAVAGIQRRPLSEIFATASRASKLDAYRRFVRRGRELGHAPGAAAHKFKGVYGHWPDFSPAEVADARSA